METTRSVFGIYAARSGVEKALDALREAGFSNSEVSVLLPEEGGRTELMSESGELVAGENTKGPKGAAAGAGSGAMVGGALGWLVGMGALVIPGIGPFIAAGPILTTLAGIGVGGALGGFTGALIGVGIPEDEAKRYEGHMLKGGTLVAVQCQTPDQMERARNILKSTGAEDISSSAELPPKSDRSAA